MTSSSVAIDGSNFTIEAPRTPVVAEEETSRKRDVVYCQTWNFNGFQSNARNWLDSFQSSPFTFNDSR